MLIGPEMEEDKASKHLRELEHECLKDFKGIGRPYWCIRAPGSTPTPLSSTKLL